MKNTLTIAAGVLMACAATAGADTVRKPKALVIMLDGMRADTIENGCAPNLRMLRDGKWQPDYKCAWSMSAHTIYDEITVSGPNHTSIATGVTAKKHTNKLSPKSTCDFKKWPSWLVRVADARPGTTGLFMYSWKYDEQISPDPRVKFIYGSDAANAAAMPKILAAADVPDCVQWYIDWPDHGGHGFGYYPYTTGHLNTVYLSDKAIGDAIKSIASRPTFKDEDWMIIVTADHGGYWRTHGVWGGHCETIPFLVAGRNVSQGRLPGIPHNYYAAPTVLTHFGIDWSGFDLDGKAVGNETVTDAKRCLNDGLAVYMPFEGKAPDAFENVAHGKVSAEAHGLASVVGTGGFIGGCLRLAATTNGVASVCLKDSDKLAFENGAEFAIAMWVKMPEAQKGDPVIVANKDWRNGTHPGILLTGNKKIESKAGGVCFNAGMGGVRRRIDVGPYDIEFGKWTFYAVTRDPDGVLGYYQGGRDGYLYRIAFNAQDIKLKTGLPFFLGQDGTGKYPSAFNGDIDDFALWTRSLSHEDVRMIYEAGRNGVPLGDLLRFDKEDIVVLPSGDGLDIRTESVNGAVGNYRRIIVTIRNKSENPVKIDDISFFRDWAPAGIRDGYRSGNTDGSVAIFPTMRTFAGVEHPMAKLEVENGSVTAHLPRNMAIAPGDEWRFSYVVGRYDGTNPRRSFQEYIEAERAHPYRVMPHYNSWFDLNINRNDMPWDKRMNEAEALGVMKAFRAEMGRRGVFIQSYLWDDGWDEWNSLWDFHPGFPNGFSILAEEAHRDHGASIGCWMSPCGGYGRSLNARIAYSRLKGYIGKKDTVLRMSNPTYYAAFRDRVMDMIARYDMNLFKFDKMGNGRDDNVGCDAEYAPEFDAVVRLVGEMRRAKPDVFVNCTVGTWASPFWVMFADSIWRGGGDFGRSGTGTNRQKWITYRDDCIHDRFAVPCPLFPLNSMMMHGIIVTKSGAPGCMDLTDSPQSTQDFADEVWMGVGCGTGLQEYYITPGLMHARWWDILAEGVKWLKANERVLRDVHWVGGDPVGKGGVGEIYGYASADAGKGVVTLRNPSDRSLEFSASLAEVLDLPEAVKAAEVGEQRTVYAHDAEIGKVSRASDALSVRLSPNAMAVIEFILR